MLIGLGQIPSPAPAPQAPDAPAASSWFTAGTLLAAAGFAAAAWYAWSLETEGEWKGAKA